MIDVRQNKGFALIFSMIFLFLIISFMAVYILAVAQGVSMANRTANEKRAFYVAEAGLADAYERITQAGINTVASNTSFIPSPSTDNGVYSVGSTTGSYKVAVAYSNVPRTNYTISSTGTYGNISKTLTLQIIGAAISKYAYWSDTELNPAFGGPLWWVGEPGLEMLTTGPVQTNGQLNIFGNPIFNGPVTEANLPILSGNVLGNSPTSNSPNYYPGISSDPNIIFSDGITNQAPSINLPPAQTLNAIQSVASDGQGLVLTGPSTIIFKSDGMLLITGVVKDASGNIITTYDGTKEESPPANGVIYVQSNTGQQDGNATVQGTVSGQLTVAADQNIFVSGSVSYNNDPRIDPSSTDLVGLVASQNITIIESSAPTQLEMSGVLEALQGSFQVDQYWVYRGNSSTAVMDQYGSLINWVCGATGEMDMSGNLLGGWNQIQTYDSRLSTMAPPGFPPYINNAGDGVYSKYETGLTES